MSELYLGKVIEGTGLNGRYLHRLSDLVTHTFVCGASGSGKTVMGKAIIEEAALRGVPAIVIDLKGDLSSLALAFPEISAWMLAPWIQADESQTLGRAALAEANTFRARLLDWGLTEADVRAFAERVAVEVFTPRSDRGRRLALPLIPSAPPEIEKLFHKEPDVALAMVSGLAESLVRRVIPTGNRDREQEYMTALIEHAWRSDMDLTGVEGIHRLIGLILEPPFSTIGVLAVEDHLPDNRRQKLAQAVNGQLVRAESGWLRGEELKIDKLTGINREDGRTQVSVINLTAVPDFEDQSFVVAQIAFAINAWMRQQGNAPGGDRPRLLFFIDEIGGGDGKTAFYPTFPYSSTAKPALNLLVKQGRAFGIGCLFATQNPGDIDYKGLSNCSTWIIGRLQTKRDRDKVREGLADAEFKPSDLAKKLAAPSTGQFMLMARDGGVNFVQERWLLTFHCTLSSEQVLHLKLHGLTPYEGQLDTSIRPTDVTPDQASNTEYLWREFFDALGTARRHLESVMARDGGDERARVILEVLKDPEATHRRLQAAIQRASELEAKENKRIEHPQSGLLELLSAQRPSKVSLPEAAPATPTQEHVGKTPPDSQVIGDDGTIVYKGKRYALYRRYAGKAVTVVDDGEVVRFSVEGRVLSKTYPRDS
jgi:Bacterial protein of unknown function (DUF853)